MSTIREVAVRARVSTATVSHVINQSAYVSPRLRERVLKAIREFNYHPNAMARSLRTNQSKTVGMIIPNISNPFFPAVVRGAEDVLNSEGYTLIVGNSDYNLEKEASYYRAFVSKRVDGLILEITSMEPPAYLERHNFGQTPVVYIDRTYRNLPGDAVLVDSILGSFLAVSHLLETGHRRIGIITGPLDLLMAGRRLRGYQKALREHGVPGAPALIREGQFDVQSGYENAIALLRLNPRPSALFVCNGLMTMGAVRAIFESGLRCPQEVAVVSFDDLDCFEIMQPRISGVAQPTYEMGARAATMLTQRMLGEADAPPRRKVLKPKLVVRESSDLQAAVDEVPERREK